ncbi:EamA family transporter RarD [Cohnella panacarvi]|uniref:EamA family transporter RarD n=1 Tax=Cohnella panacarvi TaxID=400776 RepID=UPI0005540FC0|nr:EamA family transporter RarD [Cohnella panacarvi]
MRKGLLYAIAAYTMWGLLPLYWRWFETIGAGEILSHRIVWSFVFVAGLIIVQRRGKEIRAILGNRATLLTLTASSLLITSNWLIFIWAVNNGHVIETSLGYYLTPLINVVLAIAFLGEKPTTGQWAAIAIAGSGVLLVAIDYGSFPWVSLSLSISFGLYGLVKKRMRVDATDGLLLETAVVVPLALLYFLYIGYSHEAHAWSLPTGTFLALLASGVATAVPLLFFARAASRLPLSMLGFIQYIGPTLTLGLSVFVFNETITPVLLISFTLIWSALIVYAWASVQSARSLRTA